MDDDVYLVNNECVCPPDIDIVELLLFDDIDWDMMVFDMIHLIYMLYLLLMDACFYLKRV